MRQITARLAAPICEVNNMYDIKKVKMCFKGETVRTCIDIMINTSDPEELEVMFDVANKRLRDIYIAKKARFKDERKKEMS